MLTNSDAVVVHNSSNFCGLSMTEMPVKIYFVAYLGMQECVRRLDEVEL